MEQPENGFVAPKGFKLEVSDIVLLEAGEAITGVFVKAEDTEKSPILHFIVDGVDTKVWSTAQTEEYFTQTHAGFEFCLLYVGKFKGGKGGNFHKWKIWRKPDTKLSDPTPYTEEEILTIRANRAARFKGETVTKPATKTRPKAVPKKKGKGKK